MLLDWTRRLVCAFFAVVFIGAEPIPAPPIDENADAIYSQARTFVTDRSYPTNISYHVVVSLRLDNGTRSERTYDSAYDRESDTIYAHSISEEESRHPIVPHGFNVIVSSSASSSTETTGSPKTGIRLGKPLDESDVIGVPVLTPTFAFGLRRGSALRTPNADGDLRVIAQTQAIARDYYVAGLGEETIAGERCEHLRLTPANHPERRRLRELWVAADGAPLQAITHGNLSTSPWDGLDWTIVFRREGSALYVDSETTQQSVRVDHLRHGVVSVTFRDVVAEDGKRRFLLKLDPPGAVYEPTGS